MMEIKEINRNNIRKASKCMIDGFPHRLSCIITLQSYMKKIRKRQKVKSLKRNNLDFKRPSWICCKSNSLYLIILCPSYLCRRIFYMKKSRKISELQKVLLWEHANIKIEKGETSIFYFLLLYDLFIVLEFCFNRVFIIICRIYTGPRKTRKIRYIFNLLDSSFARFNQVG